MSESAGNGALPEPDPYAQLREEAAHPQQLDLAAFLELLDELLTGAESASARPRNLNISVDRIDARTLGVEVGKRRFIIDVEAIDDDYRALP